MQRLEVSGAVRPIYVSLGVKRLRKIKCNMCKFSPQVALKFYIFYTFLYLFSP